MYTVDYVLYADTTLCCWQPQGKCLCPCISYVSGFAMKTEFSLVQYACDVNSTVTSPLSWTIPVERLSFLPFRLSLTASRVSPSGSTDLTGSVSGTEQKNLTLYIHLWLSVEQHKPFFSAPGSQSHHFLKTNVTVKDTPTQGFNSQALTSIHVLTLLFSLTPLSGRESDDGTDRLDVAGRHVGSFTHALLRLF